MVGHATLTITLFATTGAVLLILGFSFHWQATRAREADHIYDTVRMRIDTALNRGRCGMWDWDMARGRMYWSDTMFEILGLERRDELLSFGEIADLVHPEDVNCTNWRRSSRSAPVRRWTGVPHAHGPQRLCVAAHARRSRAAGGRGRASPHRHRHGRHRDAAHGGAHGDRRHAPAGRHREHFRGLRAVGQQEPAGALQFQVPVPARTAR